MTTSDRWHERGTSAGTRAVRPHAARRTRARDVHGTMDDVCSRCLKPIAYPVDMEIAEEYIPTIDIVSGARVETLEGEEDAYRIDAQHVIDLARAVAQYWAMALPMAPLCDEDCRGLCPVCGEEIASTGHACTGDQVDTRWAKLAKLKLGEGAQGARRDSRGAAPSLRRGRSGRLAAELDERSTDRWHHCQNANIRRRARASGAATWP